jgi:cytidylate kinase
MFREMAAEAGYADLAQFEKEVCEKDPDYDKKIDDRTVEYGRTHDNFVFESRLAWHFIPDSFKIRLVCGDQERFRRIAEREGKTSEQAAQETLAREKSIYDRFENYYHVKDINDDAHFDLTVDTEKHNLTEVVQIILDELTKRGLVSISPISK